MVGIIYIGDLQSCPYLDKYIRVIEEQNKPFEVVFWDRENKKVKYPENYISFERKSSYNKSPLLKISDFLQFGTWLTSIINKKCYDKLIILSTLSGIFIANTLLHKYPQKYIFDIRDYSYESLTPFYKLEEELIRKSYFTCISSQGFKEFLPKTRSYIITHNFNYNDLQFKRYFKKKKIGSSINIVWIGWMRYFMHQSHIIDKLKNDNRFNIVYHGTGPEIEMFKDYCKRKKVGNITFTGAYKNSDKFRLLTDADILNNSYGTKKINEVKYAIANKYYDGLIYRIPQLVEVNTFKHKKVEETAVGIGLDVYKKDFADVLYTFYFSVDERNFNKICEEEMELITREDKIYLERLREFMRC